MLYCFYFFGECQQENFNLFSDESTEKQFALSCFIFLLGCPLLLFAALLWLRTRKYLLSASATTSDYRFQHNNLF